MNILNVKSILCGLLLFLLVNESRADVWSLCGPAFYFSAGLLLGFTYSERSAQQLRLQQRIKLAEGYLANRKAIRTCLVAKDFEKRQVCQSTSFYLNKILKGEGISSVLETYTNDCKRCAIVKKELAFLYQTDEKNDNWGIIIGLSNSDRSVFK